MDKFYDDRESLMDNQIGEVFKKTGLEKPPEDFNKIVMGKINSLQENPRIEYQAVISKRGWIVIGLFTTLLLTYIITMAGGSEETSMIGTVMEGFSIKGLFPWSEALYEWLGAIKISLAVKISLLVIVSTGLFELFVFNRLSGTNR